jgi:hypothetical protein
MASELQKLQAKPSAGAVVAKIGSDFHGAFLWFGLISVTSVGTKETLGAVKLGEKQVATTDDPQPAPCQQDP